MGNKFANLKEGFPPDEWWTERFSYDPETGIIIGPSGRQVGSFNFDYVKIEYLFEDKRRRVAAHRLGWFLHTGRWPVDPIDHINGIKDDNRICNLEVVSIAENNRRYNRNADRGIGHFTARRFEVAHQNKHSGFITFCAAWKFREAIYEHGFADPKDFRNGIRNARFLTFSVRRPAKEVEEFEGFEPCEEQQEFKQLTMEFDDEK